MIATYKAVGQAASVRTNVLIRGESGTGKELIARAIHYNSAEAAEPFVALNCTALPSTLLESELFGHVKGSFTRRAQLAPRTIRARRPGHHFSSTRSGTPRRNSSRSCSVCCKSASIIRLAPNVPNERRARVVAATHRNLEDLIATGDFRADLYYRLRVVEICVPPLRERTADIPALAHHLLRVTSARLHRSPPVLVRRRPSLCWRTTPGQATSASWRIV
jgi:transcriptional regulator with PAS, ATPase and Fis domain